MKTRTVGYTLNLIITILFSFAAVLGKKAILHSSPLFFSYFFFLVFNIAVLAGLALGVSAVVDSVFTDEGLLELPFSGELIEDPAKILGMVFMTFYLVLTARQALSSRVEATTS